MTLNTRRGGEGPPVVILHGLFGSAENWQTIARLLASNYHVAAVDLRNHGESPHAPEMSYRDMAADVIETVDTIGFDSVHLVGHSMGGKVAMTAALRNPDRVASLCVVDIAPKPYPPHHREILDAMHALEDADTRSRAEADEVLATGIPDAAVRAFLLKSVRADDEGRYRWTLNLHAITQSYDDIAGWPPGEGTPPDEGMPPGEGRPPDEGRYTGPTLFLRGALSDYVTEADVEAARMRFPAARLVTVEGAGHWVHAEQRSAFVQRLVRFLEMPGR